MQRTFICSFLLAGSAIIAAAAENAEDASTLVRQAEQAARDGKLDVAVEFVSKAIQTEPEGARLYALRARLQSALDRHVEAVADYDAALKIEPDSAVLYDARGSEQFMRGKIAESIGDFDKFLSLRPDQEPWHWKRGISYYYAHRYAEGARQFESYQSVDDNDVENAVWRYLCVARDRGADQARKSLLRVKADPRIPLMTVYAMFKGEATSDDVLAAAQAGEPSPRELNERLFYAHLYLGLYAESQGDGPAALCHLSAAAEKYPLKGYMWQVARVHTQMLRKQAGKD